MKLSFLSPLAAALALSLPLAARGADDEAALAFLRSLCGGDWISRSTRPDGSLFLAHARFEAGPDGRSFTCRAWVGDADGLRLHAEAFVWSEPEGLRFQQVLESGQSGPGELRLAGPEALRWIWESRASDGTRERLQLETRREGDAFLFRVGPADAPADAPPLVEVRYVHVEHVPFPFLRIRGDDPMHPSPIPPGFTSLTPHLTIDGAARALDFYARAFGAEELERIPGPGDSVLHASVRIEGSILMLNDPAPGTEGLAAPTALGGTTTVLHLYTADCDALFHRACKAGASAVMPPTDMFWGDRYGMVRDPFGHLWAIATRQEEVSPSELAERLKALSGAQR